MAANTKQSAAKLDQKELVAIVKAIRAAKPRSKVYREGMRTLQQQFPGTPAETLLILLRVDHTPERVVELAANESNRRNFISFVRQEILAKQMQRYIDDLVNKERKPGSDLPWQKILLLWDSIDDNGRRAMLLFVHWAMTDLFGNMFGLLDNNGPFLSGGKFELTQGPDRSVLNGDLLDYFWAAEEEEPQEFIWPNSK
jgi:hypothetical protein